MHPQANPRSINTLQAQSRWTCWRHRRRLAAAAALLVLTAVLVLAAPLLFALALTERHRSPRRRLLSLIVLAAIGVATRWLWRELWRNEHEPRGRWHPCHQCGYPISNRSRACYCSPACRRLARFQTRADSGDERAHARLAWLTRESKHDPAWGEVPF